MSNENGKDRRVYCDSWVPESESDRKAIREQLERVLASSPFKNSKRYPHLLKYVVERTLDGEADGLKERTLGVEVFGRDPNYDTNLDPVVRITAGEIRKRLAQYYHEPGHETEFRIDLPTGSYVPEVRPALTKTISPERLSRRAQLSYLGALIAVFSVAAIVWFVIASRESALDRFWRPVLDSPSSVMLLVMPPEGFPSPQAANVSEPSGNAQPTGYLRPDPEIERLSDPPPSLYGSYLMASQNVPIARAITLARVVGLLQMKGKTFEIKSSPSTSFADLRRGPLALVGAFSEDQTSRLTGPLRFSFVRDPRQSDTYWIRDNKDLSRRDWSVNIRVPFVDVTQDFALISRVMDPTTQQTIVHAGGLVRYGMLAAGEFLTDPVYFESLAKDAPPDWAEKNMQIVISTKVVNGVNGPPLAVATHFW